MPGFGDSAFLILLALLLFGPKKLPVLARQLGKLMADFRRASNEFRTQMEEELRISEQAERQKQVAALEASKPVGPPIDTTSEPDNPHIPPPAPAFADTSEPTDPYLVDSPVESPINSTNDPPESAPDSTPEPTPAPAPIATSGELSIMPPSTGLPIATSAPLGNTAASPAEPAPETPTHEGELETETLHG
jgi:sec-independent protein translocase protein TatB